MQRIFRLILVGRRVCAASQSLICTEARQSFQARRPKPASP